MELCPGMLLGYPLSHFSPRYLSNESWSGRGGIFILTVLITFVALSGRFAKGDKGKLSTVNLTTSVA